VTSAAEKTVDGVMEGGVRSETGQEGLFRQHDDGLAPYRLHGTLCCTFSGSAEQRLTPPKVQESSKEQDRAWFPTSSICGSPKSEWRELVGDGSHTDQRRSVRELNNDSTETQTENLE
jgi:hypothetical protein